MRNDECRMRNGEDARENQGAAWTGPVVKGDNYRFVTSKGATVLAAKAPGDADAFKGWLRQISQKTAEAASEGGGLFGGGVQVSDAEKATLGEISSVLGV